MSEGESLQCKVVLIGETRVGKTSIIKRYTTNTFSSIFTPTSGPFYATKVDNFEEYNHSIKFEIWDTAGQQKYRVIAKIFYKDAAVCVLVYDVSSKKSFEELKNSWIKEVETNASPSMSN